MRWLLAGAAVLAVGVWWFLFRGGPPDGAPPPMSLPPVSGASPSQHGAAGAPPAYVPPAGGPDTTARSGIGHF